MVVLKHYLKGWGPGYHSLDVYVWEEKRLVFLFDAFSKYVRVFDLKNSTGKFQLFFFWIFQWTDYSFFQLHHPIVSKWIKYHLEIMMDRYHWKRPIQRKNR